MSVHGDPHLGLIHEGAQRVRHICQMRMQIKERWKISQRLLVIVLAQVKSQLIVYQIILLQQLRCLLALETYPNTHLKRINPQKRKRRGGGEKGGVKVMRRNQERNMYMWRELKTQFENKSIMLLIYNR